METKEKICNQCGNTMMKGIILLSATRGIGSVSWHSDEKVAQITETLFTGREKIIKKKLRYSLLDASLLGEIEDRVEGWFCPNCKKVFAEFNIY